MSTDGGNNICRDISRKDSRVRHRNKESGLLFLIIELYENITFSNEKRLMTQKKCWRCKWVEKGDTSTLIYYLIHLIITNSNIT